VDAEQTRRGLRADHVRDLRAPVAALRDVVRVAEAAHQLDPGIRDVDRIPPGRGRPAREAVAGHRRDDDVERVCRVAAVRGRVGQWPDHVQHLDHRARPAVHDDQRQRVLVRRLGVDEVDVEAVDLRLELRERVQPRLEPAEVVLVAPVVRESLHRRELHALRRILDGLLLGPARRLNTAAEFVEIVLRDLDLERPDLGADQARFGNRHSPWTCPIAGTVIVTPVTRW
jgi:hypothetical protein